MLSHDARLLIIDTSTPFLSLGLHQHGETMCVYEAAGTRQSELILPTINRLLTGHKVTLAQLDAIVYAQGPGMFTGLRIGLGVAHGLAMPFELPLIGIPCLDAMAALAPAQTCVLAATDARMNELFYAWYDTRHHQRLSDYQVAAASEIQLPAGQTHGVGVGNAFAMDIALPVNGQNLMPTAQQYAALALSGQYAPTAATEANLLYVRNKIALTTSEQAARRHQAHS